MSKVFWSRMLVGMLLAVSILGVLVAQAQEKVTLTIVDWKFAAAEQGIIMTNLLKSFQDANPDIELELLGIPYSTYNDKLTIQFEAGAGPDVFMVQETAFPSWIEKGFLQPLDELIDMSDYEERMIQQQGLAKVEGKTYALLREYVPYAGLIYNKRLLEEAGVQPPTSAEELLQVSEAVVERTEARFGLISGTNLGNPAYVLQEGLPIILGFGGRIVDPYTGDFAVNSPQFIEGVEFMKKIYDSPATPAGMPFNTQRIAFNEGLAAMTIDGSYYPIMVKEGYPETYKDIAVIITPFPCKWQSAEFNWQSVRANLSEEKKAAAARFLIWLFSPEVTSELALALGTPTGVKASGVALSKEYSWYEPYVLATPYGVSNVLPGHQIDTPKILKMLVDYIAEALTGQTTVESAMNECQETLTRDFPRTP
jgi:multiple sugar transport system substrate-binding protein